MSKELLEAIRTNNKIVSDIFRDALISCSKASENFRIIPHQAQKEIFGGQIMKLLVSHLVDYKTTFGQSEFDDYSKRIWDLYDKYFVSALEQVWEREEQEKNKT
jgi:hypothetical protein